MGVTIANPGGASLTAANTFTVGPQVLVGGATIRQTGGVAGTDEGQISHDGSLMLVESKDGDIQFKAASGQVSFPAGAGVRFQIIGTAAAGIWLGFNLQDNYYDAPANSIFRVNGGEVARLTTTALTLADAVNVVLNATTGTKIGTATSQKLGFWNATPIIQPASANQAALSLDVDVTGADTVDKAAINTNFTNIQTLVNQLRTDLIAAGLIKGAA